jgi:hypothetical protein
MMWIQAVKLAKINTKEISTFLTYYLNHILIHK